MAKTDKKATFLSEYQKKLKQGRWLLEEHSHHWATRLFLDLFYAIESELWLSKKRKQQLVLKIIHTWKNYISSLSASEDYDIITLYDGYYRFLTFLLKVEDATLFKEYANKMLKNVLSHSPFSISGIIRFINSISPLFIEQGDWIQVTELQILAIFLGENFSEITFFDTTKEYLEETIRKIKPPDRKLFFYVLLENIHREFNISAELGQFINALTDKVIKKELKLLGEDIKSLNDIKVNAETFEAINDELFSLYLYLMHIGESKWAMLTAKTIFTIVKIHRSMDEALTQLYECIDQFTERCLFNSIYELFIFLEDHIKAYSELGYNQTLIEMWAKACNIFATVGERKLLFLTLERLTKNLMLPDDNYKIYHYFHTYNYLWQFKSHYLLFDEEDFWKMLFYRSLYQLNDLALAKKIEPLFNPQKDSKLHKLESLLEEKTKSEDKIYRLTQLDEIPPAFKNLKVANMIIKISSEGEFSFRVHYSNQNIYERTLKKEQWKGVYFNKLYKDLFAPPFERKYDFSLKEFGKLLFLCLPKVIRDYFTQFNQQILKPQLCFVFDKVKVPFEFIYGQEGFAFLNYSLGYVSGYPSVMGSQFLIEHNSSSRQPTKEFNILLIDSVNALAPKRWNDKEQKQKPLYDFSAGPNQLLYAKSFFKDRAEIKEFTPLTGSDSSRDSILEHISKGTNHIIHIVGNLIFTPSHPEFSYFITNDEKILNITEILNALARNVGIIKPLIFLDVKIFTKRGTPIKNALDHISKVIRKLSSNSIKGIVTRVYPEINKKTQLIISEFYNSLLKNNNLGISLFKARKELATTHIPKLMELQEDVTVEPKNGEENGIKTEKIRASLSFLLFGEPWNKL